jgi:putative transposase
MAEERAGPAKQVRYRSKVESYGHFVWATRRRAEVLTPEFERRVYRCVVAEVSRQRCQVLAIGGMPDHIHVLARMTGSMAPATLARQMKGVSSALLNDIRPAYSERFDWQDGYGFFSLGRNQVPYVLQYVKNQKLHHADNNLWPEWEETGEIVPDKRNIETPESPLEPDADSP